MDVEREDDFDSSADDGGEDSEILHFDVCVKLNFVVVVDQSDDIGLICERFYPPLLVYV